MQHLIVCAAIKFEDTANNESRIIIGARHFDNHMIEQIYSYYPDGIKFSRLVQTQGFIDQFNNFYDRYEAWKIAEENDQIRYTVDGGGGELFSENLY